MGNNDFKYEGSQSDPDRSPEQQAYTIFISFSDSLCLFGRDLLRSSWFIFLGKKAKQNTEQMIHKNCDIL